MGGWEFGIHSTSPHKDLAWKLIMLMLERNILALWLVEQGFLPTQVAIGKANPFPKHQLIPLTKDEMISTIPFGGSIPSIPEYPEIAQYIREVLHAVY